MEPTRPVVFQILPSLVVGGAERLVVHLVERLSRERFAPVCICLESPLGTHYEARVQASGVQEEGKKQKNVEKKK